MKTEKEINDAVCRVDVEGTKYPAMTYKNGVEEALMWVLEEIPDDEFSYGGGPK